MSKKIICLEGLPRTGKSIFYANSCSNIAKIPEYYCFLTKEEFPRTPTTLEEFIANQTLFLKMELRRAAMIGAAREESIVVDRCFLSNLAYAYALQECTGLPVFEVSLDLHKKQLANGGLIIPGSYIYFFDSIKEIKCRVENSDSHYEKIWRQERFLSSMNEFYQAYFSKYAEAPVYRSGNLVLDDLFKNTAKDNGIQRLFAEVLHKK